MDPDSLRHRLEAHHPRLIDLSLRRIERLAKALGHPERHLPPVIHIAGTNGKGSTLAFLESIGRAAGLRVHSYSSPHLVRFNERIRLNGHPIADSVLAGLLERAEKANGGEAITYFEITTALAFLAFAESPADLVILETGLGGRLDATNIVREPAACVITPIALDHQQFLGPNLAAIAGEKAGIFKRGIPAVIGPQAAESLAILRQRAGALGAPLLCAGSEFFCEPHAAGSVITTAGTTADWRLDLPRPGLRGPHQIENAASAAVTAHLLAEQLGWSDAAIQAGIEAAHWPARLHPLTRGPLLGHLRPGQSLWLDGAHNPHGAAALAAALAELDPHPARIVFAQQASKDHAATLAALAPACGALRAIALPGEAHASVPPADLTAAAQALGIDAAPAPDLDTAVAALCADPRPGPIILCGSLYLAGHVLSENS